MLSVHQVYTYCTHYINGFSFYHSTFNFLPFFSPPSLIQLFLLCAISPFSRTLFLLSFFFISSFQSFSSPFNNHKPFNLSMWFLMIESGALQIV
ncbi:unnamed protein product [Cuscuta epithymum]|uniref:Uncharacterized protein n=1 Tax=Cuscuta epithymum TaxID=186058 RepID=A0AAV0D165_9ASTE|nr:unnamed protein product [Cuscuta epithymum]